MRRWLLALMVLASAVSFAQQSPPPNSTYVASDNFTRANASTLGTNWTISGGNGTWSIDTNRARLSAGSTRTPVYWNANAFTDNQYSSFKVNSWSNSTYGAAVRIQSGGQDSYLVRCSLVSTNCTRLLLIKTSASGATLTTLQTISSLSIAPTGVVTISAQGSNPTTLKVYVNGTQVGTDQVDSTSPYTTGYPGLSATTTFAVSFGITYWEGGNLNIATNVLDPTFDPVAGTYAAPRNVTISTATSGATICYTTNGSTPTTNGGGTCTAGSTYSTPVSIGTTGQNTTTTLKAIATKSGSTDSNVVTGSYTINAAPVPIADSATVTDSLAANRKAVVALGDTAEVFDVLNQYNSVGIFPYGIAGYGWGNYPSGFNVRLMESATVSPVASGFLNGSGTVNVATLDDDVTVSDLLVGRYPGRALVHDALTFWEFMTPTVAISGSGGQDSAGVGDALVMKRITAGGLVTYFPAMADAQSVGDSIVATKIDCTVNCGGQQPQVSIII